MWRKSLVLALVCLPTFAQDPAPDALARPAEWPTEAEHAVEQADQLDQQDVAVWLGEGAARFLAVRRQARVAPALGTIVLVRAPSVGANAADRLGYLRKALPRIGWNTLVVDLPDPTDATVPARDRARSAPVPNVLRTGRSAAAAPDDVAAAPRDAAAAPRDAGQNETVPKATARVANDVTADRDRIVERLGIVVKEAAREGGPVIMIGEGRAAAWVVRTNGQDPLAAAVVALNIDDPAAPLDGKPTSDWAEGLTVPALLMQEAPRPWSPDDSLPASVDLLLIPASRPAGEERLVRQVRGWLRRRQIGRSRRRTHE